MKGKSREDARQLKLDFRVRVEPALEQVIVGVSTDEVLRLARMHYRWAKQLYCLHSAMRQDGLVSVPRPVRRVPQCPAPYRN